MGDFNPNLVDGDDTVIKGATDQTHIGNIGDRLKVDASFSTSSMSVSWSSKLRYVDMNVTTGGIARGTSLSGGTWTQVYHYSGSGYIAGIIQNVETFATGWAFRLTVDGDVIYELTDIDITDDKIYDVDDVSDSNQSYLGISKGSHDRFIFHAPLGIPIHYSSSIKVEVKKDGGAKKWRSGLIIHSKVT